MKKNILIFILLLNNGVFAQTFSGSGLPIAQNTWNGTQDVTVPVSGLATSLTAGTLELMQVNIHLNSTSNISTSVNYQVISPLGTSIIIKPSGFVGPGAIQEYNFKIRDESLLMRIVDIPGAIAEPFHTGYHRTDVADAFDNVLGENPNGNWIVRFNEASSFTEPGIIEVELIFGYVVVDDISASTSNDDCSTPYTFCDEKAVIYNNTGYSAQASAGPAVGTNGAGCFAWNNNKDNTGWFAFTATSTTAHLEISGIEAGKTQQAIVVENTNGSNTCVEADYTAVSGGCPDDAVNDNRYSNGTVKNMEFNLSGLTIGTTYYLIVDGNAGSISDAYLTISGASSCVVLPIELLSFKGESKGSFNILNWVTATEINNDYFTIERSTDATNWEQIGNISGAGNSSQELSYQFTDDALFESRYYYRLKQTDFDGKFSYSEIISIQTNALNEIGVYPNPFKDNFTVSLPENVNYPITIELNDYVGRTVYQQEIKKEQSKITVKINEKLNSGVYFVKVYNNETTTVERIMKLD